jgi:hypothetical protein
MNWPYFLIEEKLRLPPRRYQTVLESVFKRMHRDKKNLIFLSDEVFTLCEVLQYEVRIIEKYIEM